MNELESMRTTDRGVLSRQTIALLLLAIYPVACSSAAERSDDWNSFASTPRTIADWKRLETQSKATISKVHPAVVAVGVSDRTNDWSEQFPHFEHFASGVIIRGDGLVLSQWHVSHKKGRETREPGTPAIVILHDGRRMNAELLGADQIRDVSLLRISEPGEYPSVDLKKDDTVSLGDWVLKLGHPGGYRGNRGTVARLGRVLFKAETIDIVADCQVTGGDSGGPLFDLNGQLVAVIGPSPQGIHFFPATDHPVRPWCYTNAETLRALLPAMENPHHHAVPANDGRVSDERSFLQRNPQLTDDLILSDANPGDPKILLPLDEWRQGRKTRAAWNQFTNSLSGSVVEVLCDKNRVALGTVVAAEGLILTKFSEITSEPQCRLPDGGIVAAHLVGADTAYDLALLKIDAVGLKPVEWNSEKNRPVGTIVAALNGRGEPMATGIISVAQRNLEGPFPKEFTKAPRRGPPAPAVPELLGRLNVKRQFVVSFVQGDASEAGIRLGDILLSIGSQSIHRQADLESIVQGHSSGDELAVVVDRNGQSLELTLIVKAKPHDTVADGLRRFESFRRDDFPVAFENDLPLWLDEVGGPIVGLDGKVVGITIARVGNQGCMAIPAEVIVPLIPRLKSQLPTAPQ